MQMNRRFYLISLKFSNQFSVHFSINRAEHRSARMSKITNDDLIQSGTGCCIAVPIWQQRVSKG